MLGNTLTLTILLHCYLSAEPYENQNKQFHAKAIGKLIDEGMLVYSKTLVSGRSLWEVTEKGKFFIEHLLALPFPVIVYAMPEPK